MTDNPDLCPECYSGKHGNCNGQSWDLVEDVAIPCPCPDPSHQTPAPAALLGTDSECRVCAHLANLPNVGCAQHDPRTVSGTAVVRPAR